MPVFTNTLGMKFVPLPGTRIVMCIHETRRMDYEKFAAEIPGLDNQWRSTHQNGMPLPQEGMHPVTTISWNGAKAFCEWLSKKEGRKYRLPTDREWSIAVGIADLEDENSTLAELEKRNTEIYPWGKEWPPPPGAGNLADESNFDVFHKIYISGYRDGFGTTAPVMSFAPNRLGMYDLAGNLWEFCEDWMSESQEGRVIRGGHYSDSKRTYFAASRRGYRKPSTKFSCDGFRVVIEDYQHSTPKAASVPGLPAAPVVPIAASATTWVDTQKRSLGAKFVRLEASNVVLDIRGKKTPVPMASLSSESQQIARDLAKELEPDLLRQATKDKPFVNSLGMKFVPVRGTEVMFCVHETRRADYAAYAADVPGMDGTWKNANEDGVPISDKGDHPVVSVSWEDATAFCAWLSKREGKSYRLPTDREWSIAVGIGRDERVTKDSTPEPLYEKVENEFPWGDAFPPKSKDKAGNYGDMAWREKVSTQEYIVGYNDGFSTTAAVMSFKANKLGLYDMGGNVWEWCEDWDKETLGDRVLRGGAWNVHHPDFLLSSHRNSCVPGDRYASHGFRCVLVPDPTPTSVAP